MYNRNLRIPLKDTLLEEVAQLILCNASDCVAFSTYVENTTIIPGHLRETLYSDKLRDYTFHLHYKAFWRATDNKWLCIETL
jgi:hypothetical protein